MSLDVDAVTVNGDRTLFTGPSGPRNGMMITLSNSGTAPLTLRSGPPVAESETPAYATLSLGFGSLLSAPDKLPVDARPGTWNKIFDGEFWCLAPSADLRLAPNESVVVAVDWPSFAAVTHGTLDVEWSNFGTETNAKPFTITVLNPPTHHRKLGALAMHLVGGDDVLVSPDSQPTTVTLRLMNTSREPLVANPTPGANPQFTLLIPCLTDPCDNALTTSSQAETIQVEPTPKYAASWQKGDPGDDQGGDPSWPLMPLTGQILAGSSGAEFEISGLVVDPPKGWGPIGLMYTGVPGFDDGYIGVPIEKHQPPPGIVTLERLTPLTAPPDSTVALAWSSYDLEDGDVNLTYVYNEQPHTIEGLPAKAKKFAVPDLVLEVPGEVAFTVDSGHHDEHTVSVWRYSTKVAFTEKPTLSSGSVRLGEALTASWTTANAVAASIGIGDPAAGAAVTLDVAAGGTVTCDLASSDGATLAVSQDGVVKGNLALPAGDAARQTVELVVQAQAAHKAVATEYCQFILDHGATISVVSGDGQHATRTGYNPEGGTARFAPLTVAVKDRDGAPLPGVLVQWSGTSPVAGMTVQLDPVYRTGATHTGADGTAVLDWMQRGGRCYYDDGPVVVVAACDQGRRSATFNLTVDPKPPPPTYPGAVVTLVSGNDQKVDRTADPGVQGGGAWIAPMAVKVLDKAGNPLANAEVVWTSLAPPGSGLVVQLHPAGGELRTLPTDADGSCVLEDMYADGSQYSAVCYDGTGSFAVIAGVRGGGTVFFHGTVTS